MELIWEKGFVLYYKEKFTLAHNLGGSHVNLDMRSDMPGNRDSREYRMQEDQCLTTNPAICKCAEGSLDFLGSEWGPPPPAFSTSRRLCTGLSGLQSFTLASLRLPRL